MQLFNIVRNSFRPSYAKIMFRKVLKRLDKSDSDEAVAWADSKAVVSLADFCSSIDADLWDETVAECEQIKSEAEAVLKDIPLELGGGASYSLLFFLIRKYHPDVVIETGVAAGWSSKTILRAIHQNGRGQLYSSDFPYFRFDNPEQYIGVLARGEATTNWHLDVRGDAVALPDILSKLGRRHVDLFHYDSDKSYSGREFGLSLIENHYSDAALLIVDDIQDNVHFRDYVEARRLEYHVFKSGGKFVGLVPNVGTQLAIDAPR